MTLLGFACLVLLALGGRAGFAVLRSLLALCQRYLDLEERRIATQELKTRSPAAPASIPPDLYRRITAWGDEDSQSNERKILLDLYEQFRDAPDPWSEVRSHLPKAPDERLPDDLFNGMVQ